MITNHNIDHGKAFDWGLASADYARYRDIYPEEFYRKILSLGLCVKGQKVLDLGTNTYVLPRHRSILAIQRGEIGVGTRSSRLSRLCPRNVFCSAFRDDSEFKEEIEDFSDPHYFFHKTDLNFRLLTSIFTHDILNFRKESETGGSP